MKKVAEFVGVLLLLVAAAGWAQDATPQPGGRMWVESPLLAELEVRKFQKEANRGDTEAAFELALDYLKGYGIDRDWKQAERWIEVGATDAAKKNEVARFYRDGQYFVRDRAKAVRWFEAAGDSGSLFELAEMYKVGTDGPVELQ